MPYRAACTKRKDDDDFGQAGTLVRKVMDNAARDRLVSNVVGHLKRREPAGAVARVRVLARTSTKRSATRIASGVKGERIAADK